MKRLTTYEKGLVVLLICLALISGAYIKSVDTQNKKAQAQKEKMMHAEQETFAAYTGEAGAYAVYDKTVGKFLYEKDGATPRPLASVTKIMTALVALQTFPENQVITIPEESLLPEGDTGLQAGEKWNTKDLISFMMINSSNDAALALAIRAGEKLQVQTQKNSRPVALFLDAMNAKAKRLGLSTLHFESPNGLDINDTVPTVLGSAHDISLLMSFAVEAYPDTFKRSAQEKAVFISKSGITHAIENTNKAVNDIPTLLASKTGYTDTAGGNLVIAYKAPNDHVIIVTVLGSSKDGRFTDIEKLITTTNQYFSLQ